MYSSMVKVQCHELAWAKRTVLCLMLKFLHINDQYIAGFLHLFDVVPPMQGSIKKNTSDSINTSYRFWFGARFSIHFMLNATLIGYIYRIKNRGHLIDSSSPIRFIFSIAHIWLSLIKNLYNMSNEWVASFGWFTFFYREGHECLFIF